MILYDDGLRNGFSGGSYGASVSYANTTPVYQGSFSIRAAYSQPWQGLSLNNLAGVSIGQSNYLTLAFQQNKSSADNSQPYLVVYKKSGAQESHVTVPLLNYTLNRTIGANIWYPVQVPLADIGLSPNDLVTRIAIESNTVMTLIVDDLRFTSIASESAPPVIFGDTLNSPGWINASWGTIHAFDTTVRVFSGSYAIGVDYQYAWAGFTLQAPQSFNRSNVNSLRFSVLTQNAGQDLFLVLYGAGKTVLGTVRLADLIAGGVIGVDTWYQLTVPLSRFTNGPITMVSFESRSGSSRFYFDDIRFVYNDGSLVYGDGMNTAWHDYSWNSTRYPELRDGKWTLHTNFVGNWSDVYFEHDTGVNTANRGGVLTVEAYGITSPPHEIYAVLYGPGKVRLGSARLNVSDGAWYNLPLYEIPLSQLGAENKVVTGIALSSAGPDSVAFRNIRIGKAQPIEYRFPLDLPGTEVNTWKTPYTAEVVSIMDHDDRLDFARTFNGEEASAASGKACEREICNLKRVGGGEFQFVSTLIHKYDDRVPGSLNHHGYVSYDDHKGYDYPADSRSLIRAAGDGILCVATTQETRDGVNVWRDPIKCPPARGGMHWIKYHAFYILHGTSGSATQPSSWYLHASDLSPQVKAKVIEKGYANVYEGDFVALVGTFGLTNSYHLHFGSYKGTGTTNGEASFFLDPYGDGTPSHPKLLWQIKP